MTQRPSIHRRLRQLQQSADALLELPESLFTSSLGGKPLACEFARERINGTMAALSQLRQAVDRAEGKAAAGGGGEAV